MRAKSSKQRCAYRDLLVYSNTCKAVVPNLFLAVTHFYFQNFSRQYSQNIAQVQFSTILSSSVAKISQSFFGSLKHQ